MDFKLSLENYQYCLVINNADEGINLILQNKLPDGIEAENSKENSLTVVNPTVIQMYVDVKTKSAPTLQVSGENKDIKIVNVGVAKLKPQTINKIQFVTLDGGKVWIADFGNSCDESVQIAEISNEVKSVKTLAETAKSTADAANTAAGEAKNTAETASSTATEAKNTADGLSSTVTKVQSTLTTTTSTANQAKSTADSAATAIIELKTKVQILESKP
nr:MAG TPA: hypothetical protein [Caudoviricetes sp.]